MELPSTARSGERLAVRVAYQGQPRAIGPGEFDAALQEWRGREVVTIQPRLRVADDGSLELLMPDDPGFADLDDAPSGPDEVATAARNAAKKGKPILEVPSGSD